MLRSERPCRKIERPKMQWEREPETLLDNWHRVNIICPEMDVLTRITFATAQPDMTRIRQRYTYELKSSHHYKPNCYVELSSPFFKGPLPFDTKIYQLPCSSQVSEASGGNWHEYNLYTKFVQKKPEPVLETTGELLITFDFVRHPEVSPVTLLITSQITYDDIIDKLIAQFGIVPGISDVYDIYDHTEAVLIGGEDVYFRGKSTTIDGGLQLVNL